MWSLKCSQSREKTTISNIVTTKHVYILKACISNLKDMYNRKKRFDKKYRIHLFNDLKKVFLEVEKTTIFCNNTITYMHNRKKWKKKIKKNKLWI